MSCQRCKSDRTMSVNGKTSDMCYVRYKEKENDGYVPSNIFFGKGGYGDYINIEFCLDCGQIQSEFPVAEDVVKYIFECPEEY